MISPNETSNDVEDGDIWFARDDTKPQRQDLLKLDSNLLSSDIII